MSVEFAPCYNMISSDHAILIALPSESQGRFEKHPAFFTGIGKVNAAQKLTEVILTKKPRYILNFGTAGSQVFPTDSLIECSGFFQRDMDLSPLGAKLGETPMDSIKGLITVPTLTSLPKAICGTGDSFSTTPHKELYQIVDMEAYALAKVCLRYQVPFSSFKYISDGSDESAHRDWAQSLPRAAEKLFTLYLELTTGAPK